jgi:hypothetical protein
MGTSRAHRTLRESTIVCQSFGQPVAIGHMDGECLLENPEVSRFFCRILVGSLQCRDGLTLAVEAALRPLHAQLGVLKFKRESAGHRGP